MVFLLEHSIWHLYNYSGGNKSSFIVVCLAMQVYCHISSDVWLCRYTNSDAGSIRIQK